MMKLSKTSLFILGIGIFLILIMALGVFRFQQIGRQSDLVDELATVQANYQAIQTEELAARIQELEQRMVETRAASEEARERLSLSLKSIDVHDTLFNTAQANDVEVIEITASSFDSVELEGVPCLAISLTTRVEGEVNDLVDFVTALSEVLVTGVIQSSDITIPQVVGANEAIARLQMVIYTYPGG
jgi:hypothetical protein